MSKRTLMLFVSTLIWTQAPLAMADPFIDDRAGASDEYFHQSFANHNNSLDNLGSSMRSDHDYSNLSTSHARLSHAQTNQINTWQTSEDCFNNTQTQAVLSGGLHNSNGSNGANLSNYGNGLYTSPASQITPDSWGNSGSYSNTLYGSGNNYGGSSSSVYGAW